MQCPHCDAPIGIFSRELNRMGKPKRCPDCGGSVRLYLSFKIAVLLLIPTVAIILLLKPMAAAVGISGPVVSGICSGIMAMASIRLRGDA